MYEYKAFFLDYEQEVWMQNYKKVDYCSLIYGCFYYDSPLPMMGGGGDCFISQRS